MKDSAYIFRQAIRDLLHQNLSKGVKPSNPAELAKALGQRRESIYNLLNSPSSPTLQTVERIAGALGVSVSEMLRIPGTAQDHSVEECYRRVGEAMKGSITVESAARFLRDYLRDADSETSESVMGILEKPAGGKKRS